MSDDFGPDDIGDRFAHLRDRDTAWSDLHHDLGLAMEELRLDGSAFEVSTTADRAGYSANHKLALIALPLMAIGLAAMAVITWRLSHRGWVEWTQADYTQVAKTFGQWVLTLGLVLFASGVVLSIAESFLTRRAHGRKLALNRLKDAHAAVCRFRGSDADAVARALLYSESRLAMTAPAVRTRSLRQHRRDWLLATAREVALIEAELGPHYSDEDRWRHRQVLARAMCRVHFDEWPSEPPATSDIQHLRSRSWPRRLLEVGGAIGVAIPVVGLLVQTYEWLQPR